MFKKIVIGLVVILAVFLVIVALQPSDYRVERSATIAAPAAVVFAQVNDLRAWQTWSPWEKLDPGMKRAFEGPPAGIGASYRWDGNKEVGAGRMTITESRPAEQVRFKLEFFKPMEGECVTDFDFSSRGSDTTVKWIMSGKNNFVGKAMCMFMNMDKMVGGDFERGLANLKSVAETAAKAPRT